MIELSGADRRAIFEELLEAADVAPPQKPYQFTIMEFANDMGLTRERSGRILEQLWKAGKLKREKVMPKIGRVAWAYWRLGDEPCDGIP